jgi:hypothetical protein
VSRATRLLWAAVLVGALALLPATAAASSGAHTFLLMADAANVGVAANGDRVHVTCEGGGGECGWFSIHPKAIHASGEFAHFKANGSLFATGTWTATELLSYQSYGCGVVMGTPLPDNLCGGAVKFRVVLATPLGKLPGIMTIFCIVGPKAPSSHNSESGEGATVVVPGIINFNHTDGGENIYVKVS